MNREGKGRARLKLIAGLVWLALGAALVVGLIMLGQRLLIVSAGLLSGWSDMPVEETATPEWQEIPAADLPRDTPARPTDDPSWEAEELVEIPIEKTAEELAQEAGLQNGGNAPAGGADSASEGVMTFSTMEEAQRQICLYISQMRENFEIFLTDPWAVNVEEEQLRSELVLMTAEARCHFEMERENDGIRIFMRPTYYPGSRIVDAWRRGELETLDEEELLALDVAIQVVEEVRERAEDELTLEKALHDWMCLNITYDAMAENYTGEDVQRVCSVLGGLLDGHANCQGYTDTFYLLGSLAGFEVKRQNGRDWLNGGHMWNLIKLDGSWYALDVTGDDIDDEEAGGINYIYFNLGRDMCEDVLSWSPYQEVEDVVARTDGNYYYYSDDARFGQSFENLDDMGEYFYRHCLDTGENVGRAVLLGAHATAEDMHLSVQRAVGVHPRGTAWTVWTWNRGNNTYFIIRWTKF